MITVNGIELRNLQEQVLKNKEDIAAHYATDRVLAQFGIKVIGVLAASTELPQNYTGDYGDAFAIGTEPPYTFWIWTRPDINAGHEESYWFNIGELAIVGPTGPRGPAGIGERGERGSKWFIRNLASGQFPPPSETIIGDCLLDTSTGDVYRNDAGTFVNYGSIRGPSGIPGPVGPPGIGIPGIPGERGPAGPAGPIVDIAGYITSIDQLPDPTSVNPQTGYLQLINGQSNVWIIVGGQWTNAGILGGGTLVKVNGVIQNEWSADIKVNRLTNTDNSRYLVYAVYPNSSYTYSLYASPLLKNNTIAMTDGNGCLTCSEPITDYNAVNKIYLDGIIGDIDTALDNILNIQNTLIGG